MEKNVLAKDGKLNNHKSASPALVLDSFALLAYLQDEPTASRIEKLLDSAAKGKYILLLSIINLERYYTSQSEEVG